MRPPARDRSGRRFGCRARACQVLVPASWLGRAMGRARTPTSVGVGRQSSAGVGRLRPTLDRARLAACPDLHLLRRHRGLGDLADADLEQAAVVARVDLVGEDAVRQRELATERAVPQLADEDLAGLVAFLVAVPTLAADGETSLGHLDVHVT